MCELTKLVHYKLLKTAIKSEQLFAATQKIASGQKK